ncbi:MAG: histidine--tRNA ligase [Patescibacteria group bacterium]
MSKSEKLTTQKLPTESYKGVRDFYPPEQAQLNYLFTTMRMVAERAGYVDYGASVLEPAELYKSKNAENEEIIKEQTYTFVDRGGREVTLRPEMTPTVARMVAAKRREFGYPLRLYCIPNFFRYERPQRGRLREFWQLNVDLFGSRSPAADAEVIGIAYGVMRALGGSENDFVIKVGSRPAMNQVAERAGLSPEATKKFFALLDRRAKISAVEFEQGLRELGVPLSAVSAEEVPADVAQMLADFRTQGVGNIVYDPSIVRGFAYYTGIVFEVFDLHPANNRAVGGGGRYDNLTELFDDEPLPGVGFAMGDEPLRLFMEARGLIPPYAPPTQAYVALAAPEVLPEATKLVQELRQAGVCVAQDFGERKLGDQLKTASKHQIPYVIIVGQDELMAGAFTVRNLATGKEEHVGREQLAPYFLTLKI